MLKALDMKRFVILTFTLFFLGCSTVPLTGRRQLSLVPSSQLLSLAADNYSSVLNESKVVKNTSEAAMIQRVGGNIKRAVEQYMAQNNLTELLNGFKWEFTLIDDPTVNAWCMPGGKVAFYTGILPICKDEVGVAVVMGHEVAHAIANHGRERMSQQMFAQFGLSTLGALMGQNPTAGNELLMQAIGAGTNI